MSESWKFDHTDKWYMHKLESVLGKEIHKILWNFKIQSAHQIAVIRLNIGKKKTQLNPSHKIKPSFN